MKLRLPYKLQAALVAAITAVSLTTLSSGAYGAELDPENLLCTIAPGTNNVASITPKGGEAYTSAGAAFGGYGVSDSAFTTEGGKYLGLDSWDTKTSKDVFAKFGSPNNQSLTMVFDAAITSYDTASNNALVYYGRNDTNSGYALSIVNGEWTIQWGGKGGLNTTGLTKTVHMTADTSDTAKHNYILTFNGDTITAYQDDVIIAQSSGKSVSTGGLDWTLGALTANGRESNSHGYTSTISGISLYNDVVVPTATDYVWTGSQNGTWDTVTTNWKISGGEEPATFKSSGLNTVTFTADGQHQDEVTLASTVRVKGMTVEGGTYTLDLGGNTLTTETLTINEGATLTVGGTGNMTLNSLSGAGTLAKNNGDTVVTIKKAANSFSGTIAVNAGTLVAEVNNALNGGSSVSVGEGGTLVLKTYTGVPNITGNGTVQIAYANGQSYEIHDKTFLDQFTGTVELVSGNLQIGQQGNKFANATLKLSGGEIRGWQGNFQHSILLNGGTIADANDNQQYSGAINVTAASTVSASTNHTVTLSGALSGSGSITKAGEGTVDITNISGYTGAFTVDQGRLLITTNNLPDTLTVTGAGELHMRTNQNGTNTNLKTVSAANLHLDRDNNHNSRFVYDDSTNLTGVNHLYFDGGQLWLTGAAMTFAGAVTFNATTYTESGQADLAGAAMRLDNSATFTGAVEVAQNTKLAFATDGTVVTFGGTVTGSGQLNLKSWNGNKTGTFKVSGNASTYTGAMTTDSNIALAVEESAKLNLAGGSNLQGSVRVDGDLSMDGNGSSISGAVTGSGKLAKTGEGTTQVSGSMANYTGSVDVAEGTLNVLNATNLSVKDITIGAGATMGVYKNETATEANEGKVTMAANTTLKAGAGATLIANLEMESGSTLTVVDAWQTGGLTMGSDVYLNNGNLLGEGDLTALGTLEFGNYYCLFSDVENLYINDAQVGTLDFEDWQHYNMDASRVFTNLTPQTYALVYNWDGSNVGSVALTLLPEPTTGTLSLLALCALAARRRRK